MTRFADLDDYAQRTHAWLLAAGPCCVAEMAERTKEPYDRLYMAISRLMRSGYAEETGKWVNGQRWSGAGSMSQVRLAVIRAVTPQELARRQGQRELFDAGT